MGLSPNTPSFVRDAKYYDRMVELEKLCSLSADEFASKKKQEANDAEGYRARLAWKENQRKEKL